MSLGMVKSFRASSRPELVEKVNAWLANGGVRITQLNLDWTLNRTLYTAPEPDSYVLSVWHVTDSSAPKAKAEFFHSGQFRAGEIQGLSDAEKLNLFDQKIAAWLSEDSLEAVAAATIPFWHSYIATFVVAV